MSPAWPDDKNRRSDNRYDRHRQSYVPAMIPVNTAKLPSCRASPGAAEIEAMPSCSTNIVQRNCISLTMVGWFAILSLASEGRQQLNVIGSPGASRCRPSQAPSFSLSNLLALLWRDRFVFSVLNFSFSFSYPRRMGGARGLKRPEGARLKATAVAGAPTQWVVPCGDWDARP